MYSRTINGKELNLAPSGWTYNNTFVLYDKETESLWYPEGKRLRAINGSYFNNYLPGFESNDLEWRTWVESYPNSRVLK